MPENLTIEELDWLFSYNPDVGVLCWKNCPNNKRPAGTTAGRVTSHGYRQVVVHGKGIHAHRIVWAMMSGDWPQLDIDHVNNVKTDNRFCNLRLATRALNCANQPIRRNNTHGFKGLSYEPKKKLWRATISVNSKRIGLGRYKRKEDAVQAYKDGALKYHGDFAKF